MARVLLRNLNKKYDDVHAVKDVNLEITDRQFVVLVGPSGCGKTTTLRMVAGLEEISSGEISIDGRVVNDLPPMDRDIAMVFQNYALYPHMSVYDNMAFGLKMRKFERAEIDKRVREAADILGIQALLARRPRQLSGGSASASRWAGRSSATPGSSCSMNLSPISTPSCACRCAWS
jgi:multiple sugar transport system ATP-binding protein